MLYLDANVFILAALDSGPRGARAADVLRSVRDGKEDGATCALPLDEVVCGFSRIGPKKDALRQGERMLSIPNLRFLPVTLDHARQSLRLMERHDALKPRDALHAAVAIASGFRKVATDDPDFDRIDGIQRVRLDG